MEGVAQILSQSHEHSPHTHTHTHIISLPFENQDLQKGMIKQSRTIFANNMVANTSTSDMYVTTSYCLAMCISHI